jgi:hypothetical protein
MGAEVALIALRILVSVSFAIGCDVLYFRYVMRDWRVNFSDYVFLVAYGTVIAVVVYFFLLGVHLPWL